MRGYQQLLYTSAFGNFRQLLYDVTLNPTMGRFLDMLNNRCQRRTPPDVNVCRNGLAAQPNENYAREILQLFSIGTFLLNQDGTRKLDGDGNSIPTYDQKIVEEFARVFTGWILAPALPAPEGIGGTVPNYRDPMTLRQDSQRREDFIDPATQPNYGKLRKPVQFITNLLRAFNATSDGVLNSLNVSGSSIGSADMSQDVFNAPSVFSFYPPLPESGDRSRVGLAPVRHGRFSARR
jgi:uncharacterized protein (DUF1800 family)